MEIQNITLLFALLFFLGNSQPRVLREPVELPTKGIRTQYGQQYRLKFLRPWVGLIVANLFLLVDYGFNHWWK